MTNWRLDTEADYRAFAESCGSTPAQVKVAVEAVGQDHAKVLAHLRRTGKFDESAFARSKAAAEKAQDQADVANVEISASEASRYMHKSQFATSHEKFQEFLQAKRKNHALQDACGAAQASGLSEVESLRAIVIALVEANEVLERRSRGKGL